MSFTVRATYKNGVLKPKKPLRLAEGAEVCLVVSPANEEPDTLADVIGIGSSGRSDGADNHDRSIYGTPK